MKTFLTPLRIAVVFALAKTLVHLYTAQNLGFHRDEFLYLALGRHLAWGFWSNPPFIGFVSWVSQTFVGDSLWATRLIPALLGGGLLWVTALMVREFGGGRFAQLLCGTAMLLSVAWLRSFSMLQPVCFDIFCWTLLSYLLLKWLKTKEMRWWWWIGVAAGIGLLNKYSIVFWALALPLALLCTPERKELLSRRPWLAAGMAFLIVLPNVIWQWAHHFPVLHHMRELAENQLVNIKVVNFLADQLLMNGAGVFVWMAGLFYLLRARAMQPYRLLGWFYVAILLLFIALSGKSYYTLGAYPALFAAGAVFWEKFLQKTGWRALLTTTIVALSIPLLPTGIPLWPAERLAPYFQWLSKDAGGESAVRWESGNLEALPQDYADMLGWEELAGLARSAVQGEPAGTWIVYAENYGQAGAIEHFLPLRRPGVLSFSDSWRLWVPDTLPAGVRTFIYVNNELGEDVQALFGDIQKIGEVQNPLARERGTAVYRCRAPRSDFPDFWSGAL